jgi:hypothetical protein
MHVLIHTYHDSINHPDTTGNVKFPDGALTVRENENTVRKF